MERPSGPSSVSKDSSLLMWSGCELTSRSAERSRAALGCGERSPGVGRSSDAASFATAASVGVSGVTPDTEQPPIITQT